MRLLEGKPIAEKIRAQVQADAEALKARGVTPKLVAILAGRDPSMPDSIPGLEGVIDYIRRRPDR